MTENIFEHPMNEKRPLGFKRPLELPALLRPVLSRRLIVAALFGWMLFSNGSNAMRMSWTYDEPQHLEYGMRFLSGDPGQGGHSNLASSALNAVPVRIGQTLRKAIPSSPLCLGDARVGRFATILFSLITAFYVMRWARQMYGDDAGIFCLFLYAFEPNLQAHSQLITTDIFAAGMGLICVYYLWRYFKSESEKSFLKYCLSVGLSQLAKYTCLLIYPVFLVIVIVRRCFLPQLAHSRKASAGVIAWAVRILVLVAISVATINFVYIFDRNRFASGLPEVGRSGLFQTLNRHPIPAVAIDAVLPPAYREGLDAILFFGENTLMTGSHYLLGRL
ncbi:MAG: glycosyltransferase family 39 protein, partial [Candidatus Omnitrophota bacterium]